MRRSCCKRITGLKKQRLIYIVCGAPLRESPPYCPYSVDLRRGFRDSTGICPNGAGCECGLCGELRELVVEAGVEHVKQRAQTSLCTKKREVNNNKGQFCNILYLNRQMRPLLSSLILSKHASVRSYRSGATSETVGADLHYQDQLREQSTSTQAMSSAYTKGEAGGSTIMAHAVACTVPYHML
jgi:hypothetical protein